MREGYKRKARSPRHEGEDLQLIARPDLVDDAGEA